MGVKILSKSGHHLPILCESSECPGQRHSTYDGDLLDRWLNDGKDGLPATAVPRLWAPGDSQPKAPLVLLCRDSRTRKNEEENIQFKGSMALGKSLTFKMRIITLTFLAYCEVKMR